jgi:hypothetical protein
VLGLPVVRVGLRSTSFVALVLLLASCASPETDAQTGASSSSTQAAVQSSPAATGAAPATQLLDFTAPKLGGGQVVGSELAGKDVAMFFWAPW